MPTEYYFGIAIAIIVIVLLSSLLKPRRSTRPVIRQKSIDTDQLANQLSRIANSLEVLVAHIGASSSTEKPPARNSPIEEQPTEKQPIEKPSVPLQSPSEPSDTDQGKTDKPTERHIRLSMFGR
jgi:hypothetical protein